MYQQLLQNKKDLLFQMTIRLNGLFSSLCVALIFVFLIKESASLLLGREWSLFLSDTWYPTEGKFNLLPMIVGSLYLTIGATILALPLGVFSALFERFYLKGIFQTSFRRIIEVYTGIPSVVFGFWGLIKLVPIINEWHPPGQSLLAGILILALMIFPLISLNIIAAIEMGMKKNYWVSQSVGLSKNTFIWKVLFPTIKPQLWSSTLLALGRAIGETMAVLMVCGNIVKVPSSIFEPVRSLTANIALEMAYAVDEHRAALFLSGVVLLTIIAILYFVSDLFRGKNYG